MPATGPSDEELLEVLRPAFAGRTITRLSRALHPYATSYTIEELKLRFLDGDEETVFLKDLSWDRLLDDARRTKPAFLYEPRRDVETYRQILMPEGIGPRCYAAVADDARSRHWLVLEEVPGVQLWQVGDFGIWEEVARWLAGFHARFAGRVEEVRRRNPYLLRYDQRLFELWAAKARDALRSSEDARAPDLLEALAGYRAVVDALASLPATFVHGEFYPLNILVGGGDTGTRVFPVDWEMAATGPGALDLAALAAGWQAGSRTRLVAAYHSQLGDVTPGALSEEELGVAVDQCRLHLALQWLGWSPGWVAKDGRAHDWVGEALDLARRLCQAPTP